ncbi:MAG: Minf_1886 family protein, partial [Planctomycetota bacterium]
MSHIDPLRAVARSDSRYRLEAYTFLYDALDATVRLIADRRRAEAEDGEGEGADRHVSGQELLEGMREHASRLFGPLAAQVWRSWGIRTTEDWGRIVFNLVDAELLRRQDSDSIEDFKGGYDFDAVFVDAYEPLLPTELDAVPRPFGPPPED